MKKTIMKITTASVTVLAALTVGLAGANAATLSPVDCRNKLIELKDQTPEMLNHVDQMIQAYLDCGILTRDGNINFQYGFVYHKDKDPFYYEPKINTGDFGQGFDFGRADRMIYNMIGGKFDITNYADPEWEQKLNEMNKVYPYLGHDVWSREEMRRLEHVTIYDGSDQTNPTTPVPVTDNGNAGAGNGTAPATPPTQPAPAPEQPKEQPKTDNGVTIETPGNDANAEVKNQTDDVTPKQNEIKPGQTDAVAPSDNGVTIDQAGLDANTEAVNAPAANEKQSAGASAEDVKKDETKKQEQGQGQATAVATSTPSADGKGEAGLNPNGSPENLAHTGVVSNTALIASTILGVLGAAVTAAKRVLA